ncbi:MAG TPA: type II toxin-antitoxin system HigB family toxin [Gemmatimonadales bacterium]
MRVIAKRTLRQFWEHHPRGKGAKAALQAWYAQTADADWARPTDVKREFGNASILKAGRVVFNIAGNRYRLVVRINYPYRVVYVRFIGTHAEYDQIGAETI